MVEAKVLLKTLLDNEDLTDEEREVFEEMLLKCQRGKGNLTAKQRKWAEEVADRLELEFGSENMFSDGKVPVGKAVETPWLLRHENLPMKPPGRK